MLKGFSLKPTKDIIPKAGHSAFAAQKAHKNSSAVTMHQPSKAPAARGIGTVGGHPASHKAGSGVNVEGFKSGRAGAHPSGMKVPTGSRLTGGQNLQDKPVMQGAPRVKPQTYREAKGVEHKMPMRMHS